MAPQIRVEQVPLGRCKYCGEHCRKAIDDRRGYLEASLANWTKKTKSANYADRAIALQNAQNIRDQIADLPCAPRPCRLVSAEQAPQRAGAPQRGGLLASARRALGA